MVVKNFLKKIKINLDRQLATQILFLFFISVPILALYLKTNHIPNTQTKDIRLFQNPQNIQNGFIVLTIIIIESNLIILAYKLNIYRYLKKIFHPIYKLKKIIYSITPDKIIDLIKNPTNRYSTAITVTVCSYLIYRYLKPTFIESIILASLLVLSIKHILFSSKWYIVNLKGVLLGGFAVLAIGLSFSIVPAIIFLALMALYDFISVYITGHMKTLASLDFPDWFPAMFIIPLGNLDLSEWKQQLRNKDFERDRQQYMILGLGDAVIPSTLIISAAHFHPNTTGFLGLNLPAYTSLLGFMVGFVLLQIQIQKIDRPGHAGLPMLCSSTILGYLSGVFLL